MMEVLATYVPLAKALRWSLAGTLLTNHLVCTLQVELDPKLAPGDSS